MSQIVTTDDAKTYALWLAGEPTDGNSDYEAIVLQHLQTTYDTFVNGGTLGTRDVATSAGLYNQMVNIPTTDWLWLRKFPPFAFVTTPAVIGASSSIVLNQGSQIGTVALVYGSDTITFSIAPTPSVEGWRLMLLNQAQGVPNPPITVPRIAAHTAGALTATLDTTWNQETQTVSNFVLFKVEYPLPSDFIRFCEEPEVQGGYAMSNPPGMSIGSREQVNNYWPVTSFNLGPPSAAARLNTSMFQVNRFDTFSYRQEFSYIFAPPVLVLDVAQEPLVPLRYRHVLSIGAAMFMMADKVDARTNELASQLREIIAHMGNEYRHEQISGSQLAGRHLFRRGQGRRGLLRTVSGVPLF